MELLLSPAQLAARYAVTVDTIHRWIRDGIIPAPIQIGPRVRRWAADAIGQWEADRVPEIMAGSTLPSIQ